MLICKQILSPQSSWKPDSPSSHIRALVQRNEGRLLVRAGKGWAVGHGTGCSSVISRDGFLQIGHLNTTWWLRVQIELLCLLACLSTSVIAGLISSFLQTPFSQIVLSFHLCYFSSPGRLIVWCGQVFRQGHTQLWAVLHKYPLTLGPKLWCGIIYRQLKFCCALAAGQIMVFTRIILAGRGYVYNTIAWKCMLLSKMGLQAAWMAMNFPKRQNKEMPFYFPISDAFRPTS